MYFVHPSVFLVQSSAGQVLRSSPSPSFRRRRANAFLEEMLPGNLERECYEENCSQEEAAEIFQTKEKTVRTTTVIHTEGWDPRIDLNPCRTNPCLNGGICTLERGDFVCLCPPQYRGNLCDSVVSECRYRNGGCMQYCRDLTGGAGVQCGCADGFKLELDGHSCSQTVMVPCGQQQYEMAFSTRSLWTEEGNVTESWWPELNLTKSGENIENTTIRERGVNSTLLMGGGEEEEGEEEGERAMSRIVGGTVEKLGRSPWQVLIRRANGYGFCGGTLVSDRWVVSAAHCFEEPADHVTIGDYDNQRPDPGEQVIKIDKVFVHPHFHSFTFDSDIALLYLTQPVLRGPTAIPACLPDTHLSKYLLKEENRGVVTGWGVTHYLGKSSRFLRKVVLPVVSYKDCTASTEQVITDNMFCAGYLGTGKDACSGDSGGPFVVNYRGTWFLTGVVSWGEQCAVKGKYGVYTRLGNFLSWIRDTMERQEQNRTHG
uniref:Coagulation factor X n=1 Tax=Monopterus albus TaxID=43700 RepID=A0A3Q3K472_MONAL